MNERKFYPEAVHLADEYGNLEAVGSSAFEYTEVWYNRKRHHSTLEYVSPAQSEQSHCEQNGPLAMAA